MLILLLSFVQSSMVTRDSCKYRINHFLLDPNEWADIFAASGAKYVRFIDIPINDLCFYH